MTFSPLSGIMTSLTTQPAMSPLPVVNNINSGRTKLFLKSSLEANAQNEVIKCGKKIDVRTVEVFLFYYVVSCHYVGDGGQLVLQEPGLESFAQYRASLERRHDLARDWLQT